MHRERIKQPQRRSQPRLSRYGVKNSSPCIRKSRRNILMITSFLLFATVISADESNHFFCGIEWGDADKDCDAAQSCPSGSDEECDGDDTVCFGDSTCDASKGDGKLFSYLGKPKDDPSNSMFCASGWMETNQNCKTENWCGEDGMCDKGMSCYGGTKCNIQDLVREDMVKEKEVAAKDQLANLNLQIDDPRRHNYCGTKWEDASSKCSVWCPVEGIECPAGESCFADTDCRYEQDIVPSASPTTSPPTVSPTVTYDSPTNMSFCGSGWADAMQCSVDRHCPSGDIDCSSGETCYAYIPGCNIVDLLKAQRVPTQSPIGSSPTTLASVPITPAPVERGDPRNMRFCGVSAQDITCSLQSWCPTGNECQEGVICHTIQRCNIQDFTAKPTLRPSQAPITFSPTFGAALPPSLPTYSPTPADLEWVDVDNDEEEMGYVASAESVEPAEVGFHFCGVTQFVALQNCAMNVYKCASDGSCPLPMACFTFSTPCDQETEEAIIEEDQEGEQSVNVVGISQNYCAINRAALETSCSQALTCNAGDPPCPVGTFCWGDHLCIEMPTTPPPTESPQASAAITAKPTPYPTKRITAPPTDTPEQYCATSMQELETSCGSAQRCYGDACPSGEWCFPFSCESRMNDEPISSYEGTYYCANSIAELDERCGLAAGCPGGSNACPDGQSCLPYDCKQSLDRCPLNFYGLHSSPDCKFFYECANGVPGNVQSCRESQKYDKVRGHCVPEDLVDEYCYGLPLTETGEIVQEDTETKPEHLFCPEGFVGWHTFRSCNEYFECKADGSIGPIHVCGEGLKFDKVRNTCFDETLVSDFCYGPSLVPGAPGDAYMSQTQPQEQAPSPIASPATPHPTFQWFSGTASPTVFTNTTAHPPWYYRPTNGGVVAQYVNSYTCLSLAASIHWLI